MNGLIPDDTFFAIINELYQHDWWMRTNYLLSYTIAALVRDLKGAKSMVKIYFYCLKALFREVELVAMEMEIQANKNKKNKNASRGNQSSIQNINDLDLVHLEPKVENKQKEKVEKKGKKGK